MKKAVTIVLIAVCAAVFCYSGYRLLDYYSADKAAEKEFAELLPPEMASADAVDEETGELISYDPLIKYYEVLREQNSDMVGWLRLPGTRISYPVMQTPQAPEYYLRRNFAKEYSANGTLFASSISDVDAAEGVVIVYGHRMRSGAMFGTLGDYLDSEFFSSHELVLFDTFAGRGEYKVYCVFSQAVETGNDFEYYNYSAFDDESDFDGFLAQVDAAAQVSNPENAPAYGDRILLLSTCEYTHENGRLIVVAVRVWPERSIG